jgi:orsellinic acid C2-O-methyltransferase
LTENRDHDHLAMSRSETTMGNRSDRGHPGNASEFLELVNHGSMVHAAHAAAELRIPDLLASGPKHVDELARATGSHAPSLHRLLRALASLELCTEREDGSFALTPTGSLLRTDAPNSLRSWILWWRKYQWPLWGNLLYSVRTGESARKLVTGIEGFGHVEHDVETAAVFNRAMAELTRLVATEVVHAYDFAGMRRIVDVGGGYGAMLAAVLEAHRGAYGVLFDLPHAIDGARSCLANAGLTERCEVIAGSFFDSVPGGGDAYLLKAVIHDWNDERATVVLRNCRRAIPPDGKLLLVERIMPVRVEASSLHRAIARADLNMLVGLGGRERTEEEFRALLHSSSFSVRRVVATALEYSVIEGVPR